MNRSTFSPIVLAVVLAGLLLTLAAATTVQPLQAAANVLFVAPIPGGGGCSTWAQPYALGQAVSGDQHGNVNQHTDPYIHEYTGDTGRADPYVHTDAHNHMGSGPITVPSAPLQVHYLLYLPNTVR